MKVGIMFANVAFFGTPEGAVALANAAEESGVESLWTVEHVVVPEGYESPYPYSPSGKMPGGETAPIPDPLAWISYMAALTTTVRLATGILILPQRNPVILAKECATIDVLSQGRLELGIGIGWLEEEFDAIGVPFAERMARTDEYVEALRALWSQDESFSGTFTSFSKARSNPKPVQEGGIPIVVGGHTKASARRAGRLGDGYFPARADNLAELIDEVRRPRRTRDATPTRSRSQPAGFRTSISPRGSRIWACRGSSCRRQRSHRTTSDEHSGNSQRTSSRRSASAPDARSAPLTRRRSLRDELQGVIGVRRDDLFHVVAVIRGEPHGHADPRRADDRRCEERVVAVESMQTNAALDHVHDHLDGSVADLDDLFGEVGRQRMELVVRDRREHRQLGMHTDVRNDDGAELVGRLGPRVEECVAEPIVVLAMPDEDQIVEDPLLRCDVRVDRARLDPAGLGDLTDGRPVVAALGEAPKRLFVDPAKRAVGCRADRDDREVGGRVGGGDLGS